MDDFDDVPPSERERERRRDRDASAQRRAGMNTGLAKQFKQVLDVQRRRAEEAERELEDRNATERNERRRDGMRGR